MTSVRTLVEALERAATTGRGVHFLDGAQRDTFLSYAELWQRARSAATELAERGVALGDRVALVLRTSPTFFDAFFGTLLAGGVPVPLYPPLRLGGSDEYVERTRRMLQMSACRALVSEPLLIDWVEPALPEGCTAFTLDTPRREPAAVKALPEDGPAFVQFSSGTTGVPKPVRLTHRQVLANIAQIVELVLSAAPETPEHRHVVVSWLPLYHDMGLIGAALASVVHGAEQVLIPPECFLADPGCWLRAVSEFRGTVSPAPNFAFGYCASRVVDEDLAGLDLSSWRLALNGAEPITEDVTARFARRFAPLGFDAKAMLPVYGLAEASLLVCASAPGRRARFETFALRSLVEDETARVDASGLRLASVGKPVPGCALEIRGRSGNVLPAGRLGRVYVRGPGVMDGYDGELPRAREAWLDTGDLGFLWDDELFLYGRARDLVIVRGQKHSAEAFERAAEQVPGVRVGRTAAFAVPDAAAGTEAVILVVERRRAPSRADAELSRSVERRVLELTGLRPAAVQVWEPGALPRTSNGKVRRAAARERFLKGAAHGQA